MTPVSLPEVNCGGGMRSLKRLVRVLYDPTMGHCGASSLLPSITSSDNFAQSTMMSWISLRRHLEDKNLNVLYPIKLSMK